jgi:hypothetical protein
MFGMHDHHFRSYLCHGKKYRAMIYPNVSFSQWKSHRVLFIGDSISQQNYFALLCDMEHEKVYGDLLNNYWIGYVHSLNVSFSFSLLNTTIDFHFSKFILTEASLKNMSGRYEYDFNLQILFKYQSIIIGSGSWYNGRNAVMNSTHAYTYMLRSLKASISSLNLSGLRLYWFDIPPAICEKDCRADYEWGGFDAKNHLARTYLQPEFIFMNTSFLIMNNSLSKAEYKHDGLHWCAPGPSSVPSLLARLITKIVT